MNIYDSIACYEKFINQMPGFASIVTPEHKIILSNNQATLAMGFKSNTEAAGIRYYDMKCKAGEDAAYFETQDKIVLANKKISFLSYYQYADNWKLILGQKSSLFDDEEKLIGIFSYMIDITNYNLFDISRFIFKSIKDFSSTKLKKFSFIVDNGTINDYQLTKRQLECLFFLIRGKSSKETASLLNLSSRTIEDHIEEIKCKLNCSTKSQIIEKSFRTGLVNLIPQSFIHNKIMTKATL